MNKKDLGHGIYFYDGDDPLEIESLRGYGRFLNTLWLSCALDKLSEDQVIITNRFREANLVSDGQYEHAKKVRSFFEAVVTDLNSENILELGCGKYPLVPSNGKSSYFSMDIDPEAVLYCQNNGIESCLAQNFSSMNIPRTKKFDCVFGIFMFHFHVSIDLWKFIYDKSGRDCIFLFNIIVDDVYSVMSKLAIVSGFGLSINVLKNSMFSKREFLLVFQKNSDTAGRNLQIVKKHLLITDTAANSDSAAEAILPAYLSS